MKVLVTGGAGFIGSNLATSLVEKGHDVSILDNFFLGTIKNIEKIKKDITLIKGDVRNENIVNKVCRNTDIIFHQAAASSSPMFKGDLKNAFSVNIDGTINVLQAAVKNNVKRVITASTSSIYGNNKPLKEDMKVFPPNFYASTKRQKEYLSFLFSQEHDIETACLRYMSVYGPNEKSKGVYANLVSQFLWAMQKNESPVIYGDGNQTRDLTYVKDVVMANTLVMESNKKFLGEIFNVGTGESTSLNELMKLLNKILGKNIEARNVDMPVKNYIRTQKADISKIRKWVGYKPNFDLEMGIRDLISSY